MATQTYVSGRFRVRDRRRQGLVWRIGRLTYHAREALAAFVDGFPCNTFGHRWVEVPELLRRSATGDGKRMVIKCHRCYLSNMT